jgi:hypothetical protein
MFSSFSGVASLLASGEELVLVIQAVAEQLIGLFGLAGCHFEAGPGGVHVPRVGRDGAIASGTGTAVGPPTIGNELVVLPVWGHNQVLGHYVLELSPSADHLRRESLVVAVALADQVGAALMTQAPPPPPPSVAPPPDLHVVS